MMKINTLNQAVTKPQRSKAMRQLGDNKRSLTSTEGISSDFENGIYICIITNQITNQQQIRKLIIQKDE